MASTMSSPAAKPTSKAVAPSSASSLLFQPYRAVGYITSHVPFALQARGSDHFVTTVVGHAYHVYNCKKLNLVFVSQVGQDINAIACAGQLTFVAVGNSITAKKRGEDVKTYKGHEADIHTLLPFGLHLISVDNHNVVNVFDITTAEIYCSIDELSPAEFKVSCVFHPSTYLNKVLFGSKQGSLQLWNLRTRTLLYTFKGWGSGVTSIAQSPLVDVVGIGLESGQIQVHNLRFDETIVSFTQEGGPITSISFRTDGEPIMASANTDGTIAVWDLESRRLVTVILAHNAAVASMQFLQSQPLLLTSSPDNSLKLWVFDTADGGARVLKSRQGHSAPPTKIRYYGKSGNDILSAGMDRSLRYVCVIQDERSCELSQGSLEKRAKMKHRTVESLRFPPVVDFAAESTREGDWDNIVSCHHGQSGAHTWSFENKALGSHTLKASISKKTKATEDTENEGDHSRRRVSAARVCVTPCGNFAIIGRSDGRIHRFNVQSGLMRVEYGSPAHSDLVTGISVDGVNTFVVSTSRDTTLKVWTFAGQQRLNVKMKIPIVQSCMSRVNNLVAAAGSDFAIRVFDVDAKKAVRGFSGHQGRITDMTWSPDGRWLLTASMDLTVRVWDVPSGRMLSWFATAQAVTSLDMSPNGDFLATTHVDQLGVFLWANRSLFGDVAYKILDSKEIQESQAPLISLPVSGKLSAKEEEGAHDYLKAFEVTEQDVTATSGEASHFKSPDQISKDLITLSSLATSRWVNLSKLDLIRQRNKPIEAPKAPERAPFFLQTTEARNPQFKPMFDPLEQTESKSKLLSFSQLGVLSQFQRLLLQCDENGDFAPFLEMIGGMGISAIDAELRSLSGDDGGKQFEAMLHFFQSLLTSKQNYELCQAYLHLFLTVHTAELGQFPRLEPLIAAVQKQHREAWTELDGLFQHALCMITYFRNPRL
eukprot:m.218630 g.218630  ORF g.218630 m.218630 type:complete len:933 (-) comp16994_c1_seq1:59-2857(-)